MSVLDSIMVDLLKTDRSLISFKSRLYEMLIILLRAAEESGVESEEFITSYYSDLNKFRNIQTIEEIKLDLRKIVKNVVSQIIKTRNSRFNYLINLAIKHIEENYSKDINLESVAEKISISSNYLSRLFLKETGMNFVDYLTNIRMENAKRLLKTSTLSVEEIAFASGYKNPNYFSRVFKKNTGVTPTDYRNV
jgi:two-component system response regulator YesN